MITAFQKSLVRTSFALINPISVPFAGLFYTRLFELDPSLRQLFRADLDAQQHELAHMLSAAVKGLDRPEQLLPVVQDLGRRHVAYGVTEAHYEIVGVALLWTLKRVLGNA